jgi:hypothetical protein
MQGANMWNWIPRWALQPVTLIIIYGLVCIIAIFLIMQNADRIDSLPMGKDLRDIAVHVLLLVLIFYIFFHYATTTTFVNHVEKTVVQLLSGDEKMFENLSAKTKEKYVANSVRSTIGPKFGDAVVKEIITPYLRHLVPNRLNFEYHILALDDNPEFSAVESNKSDRCNAIIEKLSESTNKYLWLNQSCQYSPDNPAETVQVRGPFVIAVTFDKMVLQKLLPNNAIFFREIIELEKELKEIIAQFTDVDADVFIRSVLQMTVTEIKGERAPLSFTVEIKKSDSALPYIQITTAALPSGSDSDGICVAFNSPQSREAPWFVTSLPQPCLDPIVTFQRNAKMTKLEPVLFLSNFQEGKIDIQKFPKSEDPLRFQIEVDGWTFPINGVMFTWRYRDVAVDERRGRGTLPVQVEPQLSDVHLSKSAHSAGSGG